MSADHRYGSAEPWRRLARRVAILAVVHGFALSGLTEAAQWPGTAPVGGEETKTAIYRPGTGAPPPPRLERGPHLLLDDTLIARSNGVARRVIPPLRNPGIANPILTAARDHTFQPYMTVLRDPTTGRFRLWYDAPNPGPEPGACVLMLSESADGITWEPGRKLNFAYPINAGASVIDEGADHPDRDARFKLTWFDTDANGLKGMQLAASPDGVTWRKFHPTTVISHNHDIENSFWDPIRRRYVAIMSVTIPPPWTGPNIRVTMQSTSRDWLRWEKPWYILRPDPAIDQGETQFYALNGHLIRGGLWIAFVKILRDDLTAPGLPAESYGLGYTTLAWSHDGETWTRDTEPFFEPDPAAGSWDHTHAWLDFQLPVGDRVLLYYGGYSSGHKADRTKTRQIGLVDMRRDRYVAREAGAAGGKLATYPVQIMGSELRLNAEVRGRLRVRVLDAAGRILPGFDFRDCAPITGDSLAHPVRWKRPLTDAGPRPVRLEFDLVDARLFALEVR